MRDDIDELAEASRKDVETRVRMLETGEHLGIASLFAGAFLAGWRLGRKSKTPQSDGGAEHE